MTDDKPWVTDRRPMRAPWRAFADWWLWAMMKTHRYCRIDTDSMGCPREEHPGRIVCLRTAEYDTHVDQKGYTYAVIRYDDGEDDRIPYMTGGDGWPRSRCIFFDEEMQRYESMQ